MVGAALGSTTTFVVADPNEASNRSTNKYDDDGLENSFLFIEFFLMDFLVNDVTYVVRKHYENFETIDWLKDLMRNRIRHRHLRAHRRDGWRQRFIFLFDAWSGWICVLLVGVSAGRLMFFILNH